MTDLTCGPRPIPPRDDRPWWQVTAVFDPDGAGQDFAYTVGLHARGWPELHLWARPTDGDDPGADWKLSPLDCTITLNAAARRLVAGELGPGDTWTDRMDGGATLMHVVVGDPVDRLDVDAFGVDPAAAVLPLRWSLQREPVGARRALEAGEAAEVRLRAASMLRGRPRQVAGERLPAPGRHGQSLDVDPTQRFGPRHAAVVAVAGTLVRASADVWLEAIGRQLDLEVAGVRTAGALIHAAARPVGLTDAIDLVGHYADDVARVITGARRPTRVWQHVLAVWDKGQPTAERALTHRHLPRVVADVTRHVLAVEALGRDAPDALVRVALGPWAFACHAPYQAPDARWLPDPDVLERLRQWFGDRLVTAAVVLSSTVSDADWDEMLAQARAVCVVEGTAPPGLWPWLRGTATGDLVLDQPTWPESLLAETALLLTCLVGAPTAFCSRHRELVGSLLGDVPGAQALLPSPHEHPW